MQAQSKALEQGQGWGGDKDRAGMETGLPQTVVGSPCQHQHSAATGIPGAGAGSAAPGTFQALEQRPRLRCYFVWVRWERVNAPALPDRRLRAEPNQERRSPCPARRSGPLTQIPGDTAGPAAAASVNTPVFPQPYQRLFPCPVCWASDQNRLRLAKGVTMSPAAGAEPSPAAGDVLDPG